RRELITTFVPASSRRRVIGAPMAPRPRTPMVGCWVSMVSPERSERAWLPAILPSGQHLGQRPTRWLRPRLGAGPSRGGMVPEKLRVVVALDLAEELCARIEELEPRCEVVRDHRLYHPQRVVADWSGDPEHRRTPQEQTDFEAMVDSADALFGVPDVDAAAL